MLPASLYERLEPGAPSPREGEAVVYWMRAAVRVHENPALEVAREAARALGKRLVVYQWVSTALTARQAWFVLQGAVEVESALRAVGVEYVREVSAAVSRERFEKAAVVVTDLAPVPTWRVLDAEVMKVAPLWRIDSSSGRVDPVEPLTSARGVDDADGAGPLTPTLSPLAQGEGARAGHDAVSSWLAPFDGTVSPVHHTPGGTTAGRARLAVTTPDTAHLLTPYLQHGHLSTDEVLRAHPQLADFLAARAAAWRFCVDHEQPSSPAVLPAWARDTLHAHERDGRTHLPSWEQLARAQTGDLAWDALQRQLLVHGSLTDVLREAWLKALIPWSRTATEAMHLAVELLARLALDGDDVTTHHAIARAFGVDDTPHPLETPHFGVVRPRRDITKLLDLSEFERRAHQPSRGAPLTVAIIGAGVAGAAAARTLVDAGHVVTLFDRGRAPGGRLTTRVEGPLRFDLGAPYFTVRDERFARWARAWWQERALGQWRGVIEGEARTDSSDLVKLLGVPAMDFVVRRLLLGLEVRQGVDVKGLTRDGTRWRLLDAAGHPLGEYDVAVVATQPSQAAVLVDPSSYALASRIREVEVAPCWAVMAQFPERLEVTPDALVSHVGPLSLLVRNSSKPERPVLAGDSWVLHASAEWSHAHLDDAPDDVAAMLLDALWATTGAAKQSPLFLAAHRWRSALTTRPLGEPCLWDASLQLAVCGDWCLGARVEDAFLSGTAAAGCINLIPRGEAPETEAPRRPESQLSLI